MKTNCRAFVNKRTGQVSAIIPKKKISAEVFNKLLRTKKIKIDFK